MALLQLPTRFRPVLSLAAPVLVAAIALGTMGQYGGAPAWWEAGSNERMPFSAVFKDASGDLLIYNRDGGDHKRATPLLSSAGSEWAWVHYVSSAFERDERVAEDAGGTVGADRWS